MALLVRAQQRSGAGTIVDVTPDDAGWSRSSNSPGDKLRGAGRLGPGREAGVLRTDHPPGNWSSCPPHKHDASAPCRVVNEEIYLYRIAGQDQITPSRSSFGLHRTYTGPEHDVAGLAPIDELLEVRNCDVVLVPCRFSLQLASAPSADPAGGHVGWCDAARMLPS